MAMSRSGRGGWIGGYLNGVEAEEGDIEEDTEGGYRLELPPPKASAPHQRKGWRAQSQAVRKKEGRGHSKEQRAKSEEERERREERKEHHPTWKEKGRKCAGPSEECTEERRVHSRRRSDLPGLDHLADVDAQPQPRRVEVMIYLPRRDPHQLRKVPCRCCDPLLLRLPCRSVVEAWTRGARSCQTWRLLCARSVLDVRQQHALGQYWSQDSRIHQVGIASYTRSG
eukprot:1393865-Rhodomonas_salina.3